MRRVLLVCSVHRPNGVATAPQLHWLLDQLRPDVLFIEHSAKEFSAFLDGSCGTLESAAVMHYRRLHDVELVPVDLHLQTAELQQKFDELFDRIEAASPAFSQLSLANFQHTAKGGFAYLNSPIGAALHCEMQREMRDTVEAVGEPTLSELYAIWTHTHDRREMAMLSGVEAFAKHALFKKGVLLVGSAHRQPLIEKSQLKRSDGPSPVAWEFDWELEDAARDSDSGRDGNTTN
jgi:hypothetical protein